MALDFKKIGDVELLESVPDTANAVVEVDGAFKRVPGSNLGGGVKTAIIKSSEYDNAVAGLQTADVSNPVTYSCINMTFEEAYSTMAAGEPLAVILMTVVNNFAAADYCLLVFGGTSGEQPIIAIGDHISGQELSWTAAGISTEQPGGDM